MDLAIYSDQRKRMKTLDICKKVKSFGVHTIKIKDNSTKNIFQMYSKSSSKNKKKWATSLFRNQYLQRS